MRISSTASPTECLAMWLKHPLSSSGRNFHPLGILLLLFLATSSSWAQKPCATGPISFIFIDNHSMFDASDSSLDRRFNWVYRAANTLHARTRKHVIERELMFGRGDCYDPSLLAETERLLRSYDFLSQVDVFGIPQPDGSYHVVVDTRDQWSTQMDLRVALDPGLGIEGFRLRESNLAGTGQELGFFYIDRDVTRDYGIAYGTRQLAGTRWDMNAAVGRTRAGTFFNQVVAYPFVGEVGRYAARTSFSRDDQFFDYIALDSTRAFSHHLLLPLREKQFDVAVGTRFGGRANLTVVGGILSYQEVTYPGAIAVAQGDDFDARMPIDSALATLLRHQQEQLGSIRLGMVLGQRNVSWVKKRGFDSMRGQQDVPLGADVALVFGRSLPSLERNNDLVATLKIYTALDAATALLAGRLRLDVRRDFEAPVPQSEWQDFYAEAELLNYWKPSRLPRHTFLLRSTGAGAWNTRTPFQLTLGGDRNLRGYRYDRFPGGRRLLFNAEDRVYFGWPLHDVLDIGGTLFVDAGRMWPGDVPFGHDSGWRGSAGAGLRGAFPAGSRANFRIDFATPLDGAFRLNRFRMILSAIELLGLGAAERPDTQLLRSRNEGAAGDLFRFRNQ